MRYWPGDNRPGQETGQTHLVMPITHRQQVVR